MGIKTIILVAHVMFGSLSSFAALWALVDMRNIRNGSARRIEMACKAEFFLTLLSFIAASIFYVKYYPEEKQIILNGPTPMAHSFFMEVKEHLYFIVILLSLYLYIISRGIRIDIEIDQIRTMKYVLISIIVLGFVMIGFGEFIDAGVKSGLGHTEL